MNPPKKIILVSNREPYSHEIKNKKINIQKSVGGLVTALDPLMQKSNGMWIAWGSGSADFLMTNEEKKVLVPDKKPKYCLKRVKLSNTEVKNFYEGYSNQVLWPLFHFFIEKMNVREEYWGAYYTINKKFANAVIQEISKDDWIWIHDYHFALLPRFIREKKPNAKIAFFWHIPWPPWEIFDILPQRDDILGGLIESDLLGFHTQSYVKNFLGCISRQSEIQINEQNNMIYINDHVTKVSHFPLGISYKTYAKSSTTSIHKKMNELKKIYDLNTIILGIDRLDYTKGIINRIKAFEYLIENYPQYREKVILVQIATPSRFNVKEYRVMKKEIDETVGRINSKFRTEKWTPIMYFYRHISNKLLLAYYRIADIALITPIRDGMNLIAKEYIAAKQQNGLLILSEFAGVSEELTESIIVNPYDTVGTGRAIKRALEMPTEEKHRRFNELTEKVKKHDSQWWLEHFLDEWERMYD